MYDENKYTCYAYKEKNPDGSFRCNVVVAISTYAGKTVKGYAKQNPNDEWNWEKGRDLAIARCNAKIAEKRAKRAAMKANEAQEALCAAARYMTDMRHYKSDANEALAQAKAHLGEVLSSM